MPVVYGNRSVWDVALDRIRYIFDEFENVVVNFSGGKDSTVTLYLALIVAEEKGRLPLPVMFIDQEAEWDCTIDYIRIVMSDPRVKPLWLQVPFRIFNATSGTEPWLTAWEPGKEDIWIRQKEDVSIKKNPTKTDRFAELFKEVGNWYFKGKRYAHLAGVRAEESPARRTGLTAYATYKWITWGKVEDKKKDQYVFYPLYDWSYKDIWKAIHDNGWEYCKLYDYMYQYGTPVSDMRVSNVTHETAVKNLYFLQEVEADLWNRLTKRLSGINTAGRLKHDWGKPDTLPPMFKDWREYRDHLLENLVQDPDAKAIMRKHVKADEEQYLPEIMDKVAAMHIDMILKNDYFGTKRDTFRAANAKFRRNCNARLTKRDQVLGIKNLKSN